MKTDLIALSPAAAFAICFVGFLSGGLFFNAPHASPGDYLLIVLLLLLIWRDSREGWINGTWERGWFMWRRTGPCK